MKLKKILVAGGVTALAAVLALSVSACSNNSGTETANTLSASSMAQSEVPDTLDGLCRYMEGNGLIGGTPHDMLADLIGAKEGRMYQFLFNDSSVQVELYEFDTENLNKKAQEYLQEVRENGKFTMTGIESSNAYLSDSGKYLMVYHDTNTDEEHTNQSIRAQQMFKEFRGNGSTVDPASSSVSSSASSASSAVSSAASGTESGSSSEGAWDFVASTSAPEQSGAQASSQA